MFKNKNEDGTLNVCGRVIALLRKEHKLSQRKLAENLQLQGMDFTKNTIQQIEKGTRFVTDIELIALAKYFKISTDRLVQYEATATRPV